MPLSASVSPSSLFGAAAAAAVLARYSARQPPICGAAGLPLLGGQEGRGGQTSEMLLKSTFPIIAERCDLGPASAKTPIRRYLLKNYGLTLKSHYGMVTPGDGHTSQVLMLFQKEIGPYRTLPVGDK